MKKVLHIGLNSDLHSHLGIKKGFLKAGFTEYNFYDWQSVRMNTGVQGCQARMIVAAKNLQPDLIFMHLQNDSICDDETISELSRIAFTVNFTFDVRDEDNTEWYYQLAPYFGLTLFACKEDEDEARRRGIINVGHIHSSCDTDVYHPMQLSDEQKSKYPEIVFIGNNYERTNHQFEKSKEREEMVNFMKAEFGDRFSVLGINWGAESRIINPQEENLIYNSAKIAICHNNFLRTEYSSDRQWRALASGVPTIFHMYPGLCDELGVKDTCWAWKSFDDLRSICSSVIYAPVEERSAMALNQRKWFLEKNTWERRIEQIKDMIHAITRKQSASL